MIRLFFSSMLVISGCGHDLDPLRAGLVDGGDAGRDMGTPADSTVADTSTPLVCNGTSCTTDRPCFEAVCMGDLCVVRPRCGLGEDCCGDACVPAGCNDGVDCTDDRCGALGSCENEPMDGRCVALAGGTCDAASGCQYPTCDSMTCVAGPCETARCDGTTCVRTSECSPSEECCADACVPIACDDGEECTDDACGTGGCEHTNNTASCDDGVTCNGSDRCSDGSCSDHGPPASDDTRCGLVHERCCSGICVNTLLDGLNCGFCGNACRTGPCITAGVPPSGLCVCQPSAPTTRCTTPLSCGTIGATGTDVCACANASSCASGQSCTGGRCIYP